MATRRVLATGTRVVIRAPTIEDAGAFCDAVAASAELHQKWVNPPATVAAFAVWTAATQQRGTQSHLVVALDGQLAGVVNVNNIVMGPFRSGSLGYYGFASSSGHGLVREGVSLVVDRAFGELGLHRLEVNIQPRNVRSRRLVEALGFTLEGFSPSYLRVDGLWRDHGRWALVNPNDNLGSS